ncbi:hypothetical protein KKA53_04925 [Candidatus Dependentiae bacterium]|nr:hypothetical protein [Candidatus Dependentiae bacterium]
MKYQSLEEAMTDLSNLEQDDPGWIDAFMYCFDHGPEEFRRRIREGMPKFFPGLKPSHFDEKGNPCYSVDDVCKALNMDRDEFLSSVDPEDIKNGSDLSRVQ